MPMSILLTLKVHHLK